MSTFKNHRGQLHKTNTALVALTSLYVIGTAAALSAPYWVSSTCTLAPLAAFAATPLGMGISIFVAVALTTLAIYAISRNNKISELEAPRVVISNGNKNLLLQVTDEDCKFIEENYKNEDGTYVIDFANSKGEVFRIMSNSQLIYNEHTTPILLGNTKLFDVCSLEKKNGDGIFEEINDGKQQLKQQLKTLGLGTEESDAKELSIRFLPSSIVKKPEAEEKETGKSRNQ